MEEHLLIAIVIKAFISFISTNIDDIFVLMLFFSQVNNIMKRPHIIIGQYLGIISLTIISIIGALGIGLIANEYIGLFGLVPIYLGIKTYIDYIKESNNNENSSEVEDINETKENHIITFVEKFINPSILKVFIVTFANGGDNIGIYIPLFASMNTVGIFVTVIIFLLLTALWCFIATKLTEHPFVQKIIEKYKHIFVPIIFIILGIFIIIESKTISLIYNIFYF
jgi:cadmium resistance transport/sequestration family protein